MNRACPNHESRHAGFRGQVVVIFALMSMVLFVTVGLAVDAGEAYLFTSQAERAASSAALAGVPYMPSGFGGTADGAAQSAATRAGFTNTANVNGYPVSVTTSQVGPVSCTTNCMLVSGCSVATPCDPHKLGVVVMGALPTTFLNLLGFSKTTISQHAIALYLPPIALGQPGNRIGPQSESDLSDPTKGAPYFVRTEGWASDRSQGDAYTPDPYKSGGAACELGASYGTTADIHALNGMKSTEVPVGALLTGMKPLPSRGGYNFAVTVPPGSTANLQVFNPSFMMNGDGTNSGYTMHEGDSFPATPTPDNYSVMEYTVFRVNDQFDHTQDQPLVQVQFNPFNVPSPHLASYTDENTGNSVSAALADRLYHAMGDIIGAAPPNVPEGGTTNAVTSVPATAPPLVAGLYRVRVDTLDNNGGSPADGGDRCSLAHKGFSIQAVDPADNTSPCGGCQVSGLQELSIFTPLQAGTFTMPLFYVPADYAGLTVNAYIFDPGDTSGNASISLLTPTVGGVGGVVVTSPSLDIEDIGVDRSNPVTGVNRTVEQCLTGSQPFGTSQATVNTNYTSKVTSSCSGFATNPWNSHWLRISFPVPSIYTPGYYQLQYTTGGTSSDTITLTAGANAVAVHLLP